MSNDELKIRIGRNVQARRRQLGMSQKQLAAAVGDVCRGSWLGNGIFYPHPLPPSRTAPYGLFSTIPPQMELFLENFQNSHGLL